LLELLLGRLKLKALLIDLKFQADIIDKLECIRKGWRLLCNSSKGRLLGIGFGRVVLKGFCWF